MTRKIGWGFDKPENEDTIISEETLDKIVADVKIKKDRSVTLALNKNYPLIVNYFCWIHGKYEEARCVGFWELKDIDSESTALYNTPEDYTLGFETIMQMSSNTLPLNEWKRYGYKEPVYATSLKL